jgi:Family of unknown function (DUF6492)
MQIDGPPVVSSPIVFIHLGLQPIAYLENNLETAAYFSPSSEIIVVLNAAHPLRSTLSAEARYRVVCVEDLARSAAHEAFSSASRLDREFRGGFWHFAVERLFVLDAVYRQLALKPGFHVESDNLVFFDATVMAQRLSPLYPGMAATFDADDRCVPAVLFINDATALTKLAEFMADATINAPPKAHQNDMRLLAAFRQANPRQVIDGLAIVPPDYPHELCSKTGKRPTDPTMYSRHFDQVRSVFDAAALGQYIFGVEPRSSIGHRDTHGFINETCVFDPSELDFVFLPGPGGRAQPYVQTASGLWPINNIHLHSKRILRPEAGTVPRYAYGTVPKAKKLARDMVARLGDAATTARRALKPAKVAKIAAGTPSTHAQDLATFKAEAAQVDRTGHAASSVAIDCLIVAAGKDAAVIGYTIEGLRRNLRHPNPRITIIGQDDPSLEELASRIGVNFVSEGSVLPIAKSDIDYNFNGRDRSGWLFQQLLKLGGDKLAKAEHYLVIDADTVLVRPQSFLRGQAPVLLHSDEHHAPYFEVAATLLGHQTDNTLSHVAHMMLFSVDRVRALRQHLEKRHGSAWYDAIVSHTRRDTGSGFSEFELYGQWCEMTYADETAHEYWHGRSLTRDLLRPVAELERAYGAQHRAVSFHSYAKRGNKPYA